jgi:hypothetical protein
VTFEVFSYKAAADSKSETTYASYGRAVYDGTVKEAGLEKVKDEGLEFVRLTFLHEGGSWP